MTSSPLFDTTGQLFLGYGPPMTFCAHRCCCGYPLTAHPIEEEASAQTWEKKISPWGNNAQSRIRCSFVCAVWCTLSDSFLIILYPASLWSKFFNNDEFFSWVFRNSAGTTWTSSLSSGNFLRVFTAACGTFQGKSWNQTKPFATVTRNNEILTAFDKGVRVFFTNFEPTLHHRDQRHCGVTNNQKVQKHLVAYALELLIESSLLAHPSNLSTRNTWTTFLPIEFSSNQLGWNLTLQDSLGTLERPNPQCYPWKIAHIENWEHVFNCILWLNSAFVLCDFCSLCPNQDVPCPKTERVIPWEGWKSGMTGRRKKNSPTRSLHASAHLISRCCLTCRLAQYSTLTCRNCLFE